MDRLVRRSPELKRQVAMLKLSIVLLLVLNAVALIFGIRPYFATLADIPFDDAPSLENEWQLAVALGHARHAGGEAMRAHLLSGALLMSATLLVNLAYALVVLWSFRKSQPDRSIKADRPEVPRP